MLLAKMKKKKKIFDETNYENAYEKMENSKNEENKTDHINTKYKNNDEDDSFKFLINSYINKSNYAILKSMNNNSKNDNKNLNEDLSESNIVYKLKNNDKYKDERQKENSIIINNNIQINNYNYVTKEPNTYNYYYNNSQQNMSERENINFNMNIDNYINKKYFNMNNINKNSNNYYLLNKISKLKNKRKINFKKNNFLGKNNNNENMKEKENSKESKINNNNNADFTSTIKKMENYKFNREKNNKNLLNN